MNILVKYFETIWIVSDTKHNIFNGLGLMFGLARKMAIVLAHFPIKDDQPEQNLTTVQNRAITGFSSFNFLNEWNEFALPVNQCPNPSIHPQGWWGLQNNL